MVVVDAKLVDFGMVEVVVEIAVLDIGVEEDFKAMGVVVFPIVVVRVD